jgi:signal transduction histidine kinase
LRHTSAKNALVTILCENSQLLLKIANDYGNGERRRNFIPRSINERVKALGGVTFVESDLDSGTVVHVALPM